MIKETIKIFFTNGGSIEFEGLSENKTLLFNAIDERLKWVTIESKTINTDNIVYFEIEKTNTY